MEINGQSVIITGGASGMGAATARSLAALGAKVSILDINRTESEKIASEIGGAAYSCDVTDSQSVENILKQIIKHNGAARIVVNCAGVVHARRMVNKEGPMPLAEFRKIIDINLIGTYHIMLLCAKEMILLAPIGDSMERGVIINTASIAAFEGQIGQTAYSASKGAIVSMTLPAARELAQFGIRVMAIAPGLVDTPMFANLSDTARESLAKSIPFPKRLAKPEEFALLVEQIINNPMLNGEVIRLDGALRMQEK